MMLILLFLGCFVDQVSMMLITLPFFMPLVQKLNIEPIWFGVMFLICMQLGLLTPPFGLLLFTMKGVAPPQITMQQVYAGERALHRVRHDRAGRDLPVSADRDLAAALLGTSDRGGACSPPLVGEGITGLNVSRLRGHEPLTESLLAFESSPTRRGHCNEPRSRGTYRTAACTDAAVCPNRMARSSAVRMPPGFGLISFALA